MPALDKCPHPDCRKEAILILAGTRAWCRDHYVQLGGVI